MLIVQSYHSIHEIDPEFISSIEILLKEDVPHFKMLQLRHDEAPAFDVFTYFLFFGPTQNTPVGFAQLTLRQIPWRNYIPWWKRIFYFWRKDHLHWKQAVWKVAEGGAGLFVFDPRFMRTGKEKMQSIIQEHEKRLDIMATHVYSLKGLQEIAPLTTEELKENGELLVLEPLHRSSKTYQDYLLSLSAETRQQIRSSWKDLHEKSQVELGDYSSVDELKRREIPSEVFNRLAKWGSQILTFEKEGKVLGCLSLIPGKEGNIFFEPFPFEPQENALVGDDLYIQYALIKFFEMPDARRCHILKNGEKLVFTSKEDLGFFKDQGFGSRTISTSFYSRIPALATPL